MSVDEQMCMFCSTWTSKWFFIHKMEGKGLLLNLCKASIGHQRCCTVKQHCTGWQCLLTVLRASKQQSPSAFSSNGHTILDNRPKPPIETHPLRPWQENLYDLLKHKPNNRQIVFVADEVGDQGKSWFADCCEMLHEDRTQIIIPGKKADVTHAVDEEKSIFFFDCPRSKQGDFIQCDFLEELKNGRTFSPKCESWIKRSPKKPHVTALMNEFPDDSKLSKDRHLIYETREDWSWKTHSGCAPNTPHAHPNTPHRTINLATRKQHWASHQRSVKGSKAQM